MGPAGRLAAWKNCRTCSRTRGPVDQKFALRERDNQALSRGETERLQRLTETDQKETRLATRDGPLPTGHSSARVSLADIFFPTACIERGICIARRSHLASGR